LPWLGRGVRRRHGLLCGILIAATILIVQRSWDLAIAVPPGPIWWSCDLDPAADEPGDLASYGSSAARRRAGYAVGPIAAAALHRGAGYGGLVRLRGLVSPELAGRMRSEAEEWRDKGLLRCTPGHRGRGDLHAFFTEEQAVQRGAPALGCGLSLLGAVCEELSRQRPEGQPPLASTPAQLAVYPGGGEYFWAHHDGVPMEALPATMPEMDRRLIALRRVTAILYLQTRWEEQWGGALRAHCDEDYKAPPVDLLPEAGSLVLFRSRDLWHEVLPTFNPRFALTMWYFEGQAGELG